MTKLLPRSPEKLICYVNKNEICATRNLLPCDDISTLQKFDTRQQRWLFLNMMPQSGNFLIAHDQMEKQNAKVVFCGAAAVGKTSIFGRILSRDFAQQRTATTGVAFATTSVEINGKIIPINLWDTAGQEEYRSLVNIYVRNSAVAIIVFDVTSKDSFEGVVDWYDDLMENCGPSKPKIIIVGNKTDLLEREVLAEDGHQFAEGIACDYIEVSARTGEHVEELFRRIGELADEKLTAMADAARDEVKLETPDSPQREEVNRTEERSCC